MTDHETESVASASRRFFVTGATATLLTLVILQPRLGHTFPWMIDDWAAIVPVATRDRGRVDVPQSGGPPVSPRVHRRGTISSGTRRRPRPPRVQSVWGVLRVATFVFGLVGAAFVLLG